MIELKGTIRSVSALDSNVYVLTTQSGQHVGDLTIVDNAMIDKVDKAMRSHGEASGDVRPGEPTRQPVVLPITLTIRVRK